MQNRTELIVLFILLSFVSSSGESRQVLNEPGKYFYGDTVSVSKDTYIYKKIDSRELKLDVFSPLGIKNTRKGLPVFIFFHGGGWYSGNRSQFYWQCNYFAKHGFVAVTVEYRLIKKGTAGIYGDKRICIKDAKSAIRWVKSHARQLHIDTNKVIVGGSSAGGHLATMAVLDKKFNNAGDNLRISTQAEALMLINPAYIFPGRNFQQPWDLVSSKVPPFIMFYGNQDKWRYTGGLLYNILKRKGGKGEMWIAKGQKHAFANNAPWNLATGIKALEFLKQMGITGNGMIPAMPQNANLIKRK